MKVCNCGHYAVKDVCDWDPGEGFVCCVFVCFGIKVRAGQESGVPLMKRPCCEDGLFTTGTLSLSICLPTSLSIACINKCKKVEEKFS